MIDERNNKREIRETDDCYLSFRFWSWNFNGTIFPNLVWLKLKCCLKWSTKRAVSARLAGIYQEIDWMACQCKFVFTLISRTRPVILHESSIGNEMPTKAGNSSLLIAQLSSTAPLHEPTARSITFHENWSIYRNSRHWTIKCYKWRCRVPF